MCVCDGWVFPPKQDHPATDPRRRVQGSGRLIPIGMWPVANTVPRWFAQVRFDGVPIDRRREGESVTGKFFNGNVLRGLSQTAGMIHLVREIVTQSGVEWIKKTIVDAADGS